MYDIVLTIGRRRNEPKIRSAAQGWFMLHPGHIPEDRFMKRAAKSQRSGCDADCGAIDELFAIDDVDFRMIPKDPRHAIEAHMR